MKLRFRFPRLQLLFLLAWAASMTVPSAPGLEVVTTADGQRRELKVLGVNGTNLQVQIGAGMLGIPLASVKEVQMAAPPEFAQAQKLAVSEPAKALAMVRGITDKYKGIPVDWAQQATGMLGGLYLATNDPAKAEVAFKDFQKLYPGAGSTQADVGMARIALSKKDYDTAKKKLEPITEAALKEKNVSRTNAFAYSQAFLAMGEIKEHDNNLPGALEDYLRTVTLFYHDPTAVTVAQERAEALRSQKISVP